MFSRLPMVAISRDLRKPGPTSVGRPRRLFADRLALSIRGVDRVLIDANTFPSSNLFSGHSASTRPEASSPPSPDVAHQPAVLLLRHEHVPSVAGAHVSVLGR